MIQPTSAGKPRPTFAILLAAGLGVLCVASTAVADIAGTYATSTSITANDSWASGSITIEDGITLTVNPGVTITYDSTSNRNLVGPGTFINEGTLNHTFGGGADNIELTNGASFQNDGVFDFQSKGDVSLYDGTSFVNNGTLQKTGVAATEDDPSYFFRGGTFTNAAGATVLSESGVLDIAVGNSVSDAASTWTANGGQIQLGSESGGSWSGTFNGAGTHAVFVGNNGNDTVKDDFRVGVSGVTVNFTGTGGFEHRSNAIDTNGNTFTNTGLFKFTTANTKTIAGTGILANAAGGTMQWTDGVISLGSTAKLANSGSFIASGTTAKSLQGTGTFQWLAGTITINDSDLTNEAKFTFAGSDTKTLQGANDLVNAANGTMDLQGGNINLNGTNLVNNGTFKYTNTSTNQALAGNGTFTNNGTFLHEASGSGDNLDGSDTGSFVNNGLYHFTGEGDFQITAGYTFTNNASGTIRQSANTGENLFFAFASASGAGTLDNQGTVEVVNGILSVNTSASSTTTLFADINLVQYNAATKALTGGTWIVDATADGSATFNLEPANDGIEILGENAVVRLTAAGSNFVQLENHLQQVDGQLFVNGTRTFAVAGPGPLAIGATGTLGGDGTIDGSLTVAAGGTLTPGASAGTLTVLGDLTLADGALLDFELASPTASDLVDVSSGTLSYTDLQFDDFAFTALADFAPGTYVLFDAATLSGSLGTNLSGTIDGYAATLSADTANNDLVLTVVPEPGTLVLILAGSAALLLWHRRRQAARRG